MPFKLPTPINLQCINIIIKSVSYEIIEEDEYKTILILAHKLTKNEVFIQDVRKIISIIKQISNHIHNPIIGDTSRLISILELFIITSAQPVYPCGMWSH